MYIICIFVRNGILKNYIDTKAKAGNELTGSGVFPNFMYVSEYWIWQK